ncbi:hypothetical protein F4805DRAFT_262847 [Annulohypoxylon moriforme]|nr:hypothetical protein F4805DRAFT_262847 [Annulohypoxylon moriforme]
MSDVAHDLQLVEKSETGETVYCSMDKIEKYLVGAENPAAALGAILHQVQLHVDEKERFEEWVSRLIDVAIAGDFWKGGEHSTLDEWKNANDEIITTAQKGRTSRNKRKEVLARFTKAGVGGPRFGYLAENSSRTLLEAILSQIVNHGFSYPLVCCLANIKAYHRIQGPGMRGIQRTRSTQPIDLTSLDKVTYRQLTPKELASANVVVGQHGLLVPSDKPLGEVIDDPAFDEAVKTFLPGKSGFEQPFETARLEPSVDGDSTKQKSRKKTETVKPELFAFAVQCTCGSEVTARTKELLEDLTMNSIWADLGPLVALLRESSDGLCQRHCEMFLVRGIGVEKMDSKEDLDTLRDQVRKELRDMESFQDNESTEMKERYDHYKKSLGFSWDLVHKQAKRKFPSGTSSANKRNKDSM